jgi:2-dehydropantoate 2-reductase
MDIAILGSGAVGSYGAKLAIAGHRVCFIARGGRLAAIPERGLEVGSPLGDSGSLEPVHHPTTM